METIQGRKLFQGRNYMGKYGIWDFEEKEFTFLFRIRKETLTDHAISSNWNGIQISLIYLKLMIVKNLNEKMVKP